MQVLIHPNQTTEQTHTFYVLQNTEKCAEKEKKLPFAVDEFHLNEVNGKNTMLIILPKIGKNGRTTDTLCPFFYLFKKKDTLCSLK